VEALVALGYTSSVLSNQRVQEFVGAQLIPVKFDPIKGAFLPLPQEVLGEKITGDEAILFKNVELSMGGRIRRLSRL
jgi:hypothetical protein